MSGRGDAGEGSAAAREDRADAVVIGGGPAGSAAATLLARKGRRVVLLERERFPREHVGESLLPASLPILEALGALPAVEAAGFLPKHGATMVWGTDAEPWSWYFRETNRAWPSAFQVVRSEFDRILLDHARASGAEVREGCRAIEAAFADGRASGVRYRRDDGREGMIEAAWVVDASGQSALLGRALGLREWDSFFRNLALYGYFEGAARLPEPDATNIFIESCERGWCWTIPLHTGRSSVGVVLDAEAGRRAVAESGAEAAFRAHVEAAPRTAALLAGARLADGPHVVRDWSYASREVAGPGWALAGDAACFVDPLFSSGVHLALTSGLLAAALAGSALADPAIEEAAADAYRSLFLGQYRNFHQLARLFYASNRSADSYFWEARRLSGDEASGPREAFVRMVAGQSPIGYERAVIDRAPPGFAEGVAAVEAGRARRRAAVEAASPQRLAAAVPRLASGARVERRAVLDGDEFRWGRALTSEQRPEGVELSQPVARLLEAADGRASVAGLAARLASGAGLDDGAAARLTARMASAVAILYVDGAIESLAGLEDGAE